MKISDMIVVLQAIQETHGDLKCGIFEDGGPWNEFDSIDLAKYDYTGELLVVINTK